MITKFKTLITQTEEYGIIDYDQSDDICYLATSSSPELLGYSTTIEDLLTYWGDKIMPLDVEHIKNNWKLIDVELIINKGDD